MTFYAEVAIRMLWWGLILAGSGSVVLGMVRRGRIEGGQNQLSVLPGKVRRWFFGESTSK
jgi:hypothetical protein